LLLYTFLGILSITNYIGLHKAGFRLVRVYFRRASSRKPPLPVKLPV
jgi:hypothetical protein